MMRTAALMTAALGLLAGCGDNAEENILGAVGTVADVLTPGDSGEIQGGTSPAAVGFTPAEIAETPENYRMFTINAMGVAELARLIGVNGSRLTFVSQSGFTATYDDGVLIATRGLLGEDVMAATSAGVTAALRQGSGTVTRQFEILDSVNQIATTTYSCVFTPAGRETVNLGVRQVELNRVDERCTGERQIFDNIYWVDNAGAIIASRQYVSPTVAYLRANRL